MSRLLLLLLCLGVAEVFASLLRSPMQLPKANAQAPAVHTGLAEYQISMLEMPEGHEMVVGPVTSSSALAYLERHPELPLHRLVVVALDPPITDEVIEGFVEFLDEVFDSTDVPFSVCWEVRGKAFPTMKQFKRVVSWLGENDRSASWDARVQGNVRATQYPHALPTCANACDRTGRPSPAAIHSRPRACIISLLTGPSLPCCPLRRLLAHARAGCVPAQPADARHRAADEVDHAAATADHRREQRGQVL